MDRIPFGISRLDTIIGGGSPPGSVVLLVGEAGAGAREFLYTCAVMNGVAHGDRDLFDLHYGSLDPETSVPEEIHYLSLTAGEPELTRELRRVMGDELVEASIDAIEFEDLSSTYFQLSPVPPSWFSGQHRAITELGEREDRRDTLEVLGDYFDEHAEESLVVVDALSDLAAVTGDRWEWSDIALLIKGLQKAARTWDGLILLLVNREGLTETELGTLVTSTDGSFFFEWASGGNELDRTMVVREFRGVLALIEEENIVRFETEVHESGFDISDVRKIR